MKNCCQKKIRKSCKRRDGKIFSFPRKFTRKQCKKARGFTMKASCAPYKFCKKSKKK